MAAISPPTLTASSFCSAQKKESVIFLLQTMIKLNLKKKKKGMTNNCIFSLLVEHIIRCLVIEHLLHLERVDRVKVQLFWELCHSSLVGYSCPVPDSGFGQLKHPVSARSVSDVTWKV